MRFLLFNCAQVEAGVQVINAKGKYVMPGGIDPHTHLAMPFMGTESCDDFFSGHAAALAGGTTMHIDFALPTGGDLLKGFADYIEKSARNAAMDYGFHMAVTKWDTKVSADMATLVSKGELIELHGASYWSPHGRTCYRIRESTNSRTSSRKLTKHADMDSGFRMASKTGGEQEGLCEHLTASVSKRTLNRFELLVCTYYSELACDCDN